MKYRKATKPEAELVELTICNEGHDCEAEVVLSRQWMDDGCAVFRFLQDGRIVLNSIYEEDARKLGLKTEVIGGKHYPLIVKCPKDVDFCGRAPA